MTIDSTDLTDPPDRTGRTVMITGASNGIGRVAARFSGGRPTPPLEPEWETERTPP